MSRSLVRIAPRLLCSYLLVLPSIAHPQSLEPPPSLPPSQPGTGPAYPPPPSSTYEEAEDSGLGLEWVWINADIGGAYVNMQSFSTSNLALNKTETGGPAFGVAAGVRLSLEGALHTRIGHIDPYFGVRGGYNFVGSLSSDSVQVAGGSAPPDVSVHGFNIGPMVGIDVYLAKLISIGADIDAQFLFLQRPKPPLPPGVQLQTLPAQYQTLYNESGSSVGFGVTGAAHLGIHF
jgi:hypothetical protein